MGWCFAVCALLVLSCSGGEGDDQAPDGNANGGGKRTNQTSAPEPTRKVMLSMSVARLSLGARLQIRGHLFDKDGEAVDDALVSFALVGHAEGSSLDGLDASTDKRGSFQNALSAGQRPSAFRVRASAADAADAFIDVAVSDAGFGSLLITADYAGARLVAQRSVFAQAKGSCDDDSERGEDDPFVALSDRQEEALLPALPAGVAYAVRVVAQSALGTVVARGCIDGVKVAADAETAVEVAFADEPLARSGEFTLQAELDASGPASVLKVALSASAAVLIDGDILGAAPPPDADAFLLLNTLDEALRSEGDAEPDWLTFAQALESDRSAVRDVPDGGPPQDTPDHELQALLGLDDRGPRLAIDAMAQRTQDDLTQMRLTSVVVLVPAGSTPATWQPQRIEALPMTENAPPMLIDLTLVKTGTTSRAEFVAARDVLDLSRLSFRAKFGALATQVLRGVLRPQDEGGQLEEMRETLGCAVLSRWLRARAYPGACNASCVEGACDRTLAALQGAAEGAFRAIDVARPTVAFSGEFVLGDRDSDLMAETLECDDFKGEWAAEREGGRADVITGKASAVAPPPAQ